MRLAVAPQEVLQRQQRGRLRLADEDRTAGAGFDQGHAPQDQRAHDALAQVGLGDDQRAQLLRWNQQHLDVVERLAVDERRAPGQLADLGEELPRPLLHDRHDAPHAVALRDAHVALEHDEHARAALAGREQATAALEALARPEAPDALDFFAREHRKHLVLARAEGGGGRGVAVSHGHLAPVEMH